MKKLRATTTTTTTATTTKNPQMGETMKKLKAKKKTNQAGITKSRKFKERAPTTTTKTTTIIARKKTKEPAMETSMKSEAGEVKRNLKLKSTSKEMKTTKMSGRRKSM